MGGFVKTFIDTFETFIAWLSTSLNQTTESYCDLETSDDQYSLVAHDGSLVSILKIDGVSHLLGNAEFERLSSGINLAFQPSMKRQGHAFQFFYYYDKDRTKDEITSILSSAVETSNRLKMDLKDLFNERINFLSRYCGTEKLYLVLWTFPSILSDEQNKQAMSDKLESIRKNNIPPLLHTQNIFAGFKEIRDEHSSFVKTIVNDFDILGINADLLEAHDAIYAIREVVDPDFTDKEWRPVLPGDTIPPRDLKDFVGDLAGVMWPPLAQQILPRDAENLDIRTCRIGDKIYSSIFINLFPQEVKPFVHLFNKLISINVPWRISYFVEGGAASSMAFKSVISAIISFAAAENKLISDSANMLRYMDVNTDESIVKLRVSLSTWARVDQMRLLKERTAELAKAVQGWGTCEVSEICGDAFAGAVSSMLAVTTNHVAVSSVAPLSDVILMSPITRPSSPWEFGAVLFRSPDGKVWPYQPGSSQQNTWIDLFYARPGSGKSVLSNTINLALCLAPGIMRLPRIAIIDIGPSSSGFISLIKESLPKEFKHYATYQRLRMTPEFSVNPFDTQLGCRFPTPQERSFLVNFLTLLGTPVGSNKPYDGIPDMVGLVVDELYKNFSDDINPRVYTSGVDLIIDGILEEIGFVFDDHTTWWEVTDALFVAGFIHEATLAQRYAMPLLADAASICRTPAIEDLYGKIIAPTGEPLILAFSRMISGAVREYPVLSRITAFDIGDSRIVSLDLDEVAKSGGDASERQTAVMYMLARYILARHFYLTEENVSDMPSQYRNYHEKRIAEIREDPKRLVYDEFHRTSKAQAVRDQIIVDMREGRKWKVQVAVISQSLDDFDKTIVEFATSVFVMDAGPEQTIEQTTRVFGLSDTAKNALRTRVHGPREGGATFLSQFSTKFGMNTQLLTSTIGPIELWAFTTTSEDVIVRNRLYKSISPSEARRFLGSLFPNGTVKHLIENRLEEVKQTKGFIEDGVVFGVIDKLVKEILDAYSRNPNAKSL